MKLAFKKATLPNGLRVITEEVPYVRSVSVGIWVGTGSRYEAAAETGVSHFIEHLLFKGTEGRSAKDIAETIDSVGGQLNAFTGKEYTCFYCRVLDEHLPLAVDLLSDMILNSLFDRKDVEKERGVVLEEIRLYQDTPDELVHDLLAETMWGGHPLGRAIVGTEESLGAMTRDSVLDYFRGRYTPDNMVVAAVGNLEHEAVLEMTRRAFSGLQGRWRAPEQVPPRVSPRIALFQKTTEQVHLCLGTEGIKLEGDDYYPLHVLNTVLGGGTSSRLFQEIREDRGLAYSVFSYQTSYRDTGLFAMYAGMSPAFVPEVLKVAKDEFARLGEEGIGEEELARAKEQLKGSLMLGLESTSNRMTRLGKSELLLGRVVGSDETISNVNTVTAEDIKRLAKKLLRRERMALTAIGPVEGDEVEGIWRK